MILPDGSGTATSHIDNGLNNGTGYNYRVSAVNSSGTGPASPPQNATPAAPVSGRPVAEAGAQAHWLFGSDNPSYADLVSAQIATGPAHALQAGYMTSPTGTAQGRDSGIPEAAEQTTCFVFRLAGSTDSMIGGTLQLPGDDGSRGTSLYTRLPSSLYANMRGGWGNSLVNGSLPLTPDFVFVALSKNAATGDYVLFSGDQSGNGILTGTSALSTSSRTIGIGNLHFNNSGFSGQISLAEAIIFDSAKTETELEAIYTRSRSRLAARRLTVL